MILNKYKLPATLQDYCDALSIVSKLSESYQSDIAGWLTQFDSELAYENESQEETRKLNDIILGFNSINLPLISKEKINVAKYERTIAKIIDLRAKLTSVKIWIRSVRCVFNTPETIKLVQEDISALEQGMQNIEKYLENLKKIVNNNRSHSSYRKIFKNKLLSIENMLLV
jgi:hypothetical protein